MNKKKLGLLVLSLVLIATIGVGATLAYFTDAEKATNTITMGHVDIDLKEPNYDPGDDDDIVEDIVPGQVIPKDPTITVNADSEDAYIRAKIELKKLDKDGKVTFWTASQAGELLAGISINDGWFLAEDGYYYYKDIVSGKNKTLVNEEKNLYSNQVVLFETVTIPEKWGNEVADMTFTIDVSAEAIQAKGFTPDKNNDGFVTGWYYKTTDADGNEVKKAISAENYVAPESAE